MIPPRFRQAIADLTDERLYPMWWIEQQIEAGTIMLMENEAAIIGVERRIYPGGAIELHGLFAAGAIDAIVRLIEDACEAGRIAGCIMASISSRPGWSRVLKDRGFAMSQQTLVKDLV